MRKLNVVKFAVTELVIDVKVVRSAYSSPCAAVQ